MGFEPTLPKGLVAESNSNTQFKLHVNFCSAHDCAHNISCLWACILGFHPRDETAMLVYKIMAKCRSSFA